MNGTIYLLHFEKPIGDPTRPRMMAQHYLGWTTNLELRLRQHKQGYSGSNIVKAFHNADIMFSLVMTWPGDRSLERHLKNNGHFGDRLCPICKAIKQAERKDQS